MLLFCSPPPPPPAYFPRTRFHGAQKTEESGGKGEDVGELSEIRMRAVHGPAHVQEQFLLAFLDRVAGQAPKASQSAYRGPSLVPTAGGALGPGRGRVPGYHTVSNPSFATPPPVSVTHPPAHSAGGSTGHWWVSPGRRDHACLHPAPCLVLTHDIVGVRGHRTLLPGRPREVNR